MPLDMPSNCLSSRCKVPADCLETVSGTMPGDGYIRWGRGKAPPPSPPRGGEKEERANREGPRKMQAKCLFTKFTVTMKVVRLSAVRVQVLVTEWCSHQIMLRIPPGCSLKLVLHMLLVARAGLSLQQIQPGQQRLWILARELGPRLQELAPSGVPQ